jgi:hypothetical protein
MDTVSLTYPVQTSLYLIVLSWRRKAATQYIHSSTSVAVHCDCVPSRHLIILLTSPTVSESNTKTVITHQGCGSYNQTHTTILALLSLGTQLFCGYFAQFVIFFYQIFWKSIKTIHDRDNAPNSTLTYWSFSPR